MQNYSIILTPHAEQDVNEINHYITCILHNVSAANKLLNKFEHKLKLLTNTPEMCPIVIFDGNKIQYRKCIVDNYIAFYFINDKNKEIIVERIIYASRDFAKLL